MVNPGIQYGGLLGYSKYLINSQLDKSFTSRSILIEGKTEWPEVFDKINKAALKLPCIIKPDIGERSKGVKCVHDIEALRESLNTQNSSIFIEEFIHAKNEYGILYSKLPGETAGEISSFVRKVGIPQEAEDKLNFSHISKKLRFEDLTPYITKELVVHFDKISTEINGFYFGRFDIKANNIEELTKGVFTIIELNGIGSVPLHVYDPHTSIRACYKHYGRHYKRALEIATANNDSTFYRYDLTALLSMIIKTYVHLNKIS